MKNNNRRSTGCLIIYTLLVLITLEGSACGKKNLRSEPRNENLASRRLLLVCPEKRQLEKNDLEVIAKKYDVQLEDILKLNERCRVKDSTAIDLDIKDCERLKEPACANGTLVLPLH